MTFEEFRNELGYKVKQYFNGMAPYNTVVAYVAAAGMTGKITHSEWRTLIMMITEFENERG